MYISKFIDSKTARQKYPALSPLVWIQAVDIKSFGGHFHVIIDCLAAQEMTFQVEDTG